MKIIDVTLRESLYTNCIISYEQAIEYLRQINIVDEIEYIEIGYIDVNYNIKPLGTYDETFLFECSDIMCDSCKLSAMLHIDQFSPEEWSIEALKCLGMVRVLIDENYDNLDSIVNYFHALNIKVSINCSYISRKSLAEFEDMILKVVRSKADVMYIADTNGCMLPGDILSYIEIAQKYKKHIKLGIHTHNNMGLALANAYIPDNIDYLDASLNGFGKGAGNVRLEVLLAIMYREQKNNNYDKKLYALFTLIEFFYSEIVDIPNSQYYDNFENLLYAYKNLKLSEILEFKKIPAFERISVILCGQYSAIDKIISYSISKVPYYKQREKLYTRNFIELPIINKKIYQQNVPPYSNALLSKAISKSFIFSTSGTTQEPQFVIRDVNDIDYQVNDYIGLGIGKNDIVLNLFWAGLWGIYTTTNLTLEKTEATVIPYGGNILNDTELKNIENIILKFRVNVLFGVPSTIVHIAKHLSHNDECRKYINKIFCLGEKLSLETHKFLTSIFPNVSIKSKYGCMETAGIGYQCHHINGSDYHIYDNRYVEIVDINSNQPLAIGKVGRIVVTTLNQRLIPLIRYDSGDIGCIDTCTCPCGATHILKVYGRQGKDFIIGSVHIQIELVDSIIQSNSTGYIDRQITISKQNQKDSLDISIIAKSANTNKIKSDLLSIYPDLNGLLVENRINDIIVHIINIEKAIRNKTSGKILPIIDKR